MLKHLYIRNYALFAETDMSFPRGLNILTGETGAGKSLLVGAMGLIMGKRADNSAIFYSEERCVIEAEFGELAPEVMANLQQQDDFDFSDGQLIIRREIRPGGKSRAFINDTPVSLGLLRDVSAHLLDLHGQHENQGLLQQDKQLQLLDAYAGCVEEAATFSQSLRHCKQLQQSIRELEARESQAKQQLEYLQFQLSELETANLQANEEEDLEQEFNLLQHSEDIREALGAAVDQLYEQDLAVYTQLSEVVNTLDKVAEVSSGLGAEHSRLQESQEIIKEVSFSLRNMLESVESDPERLAFIEERLSLYHKLKLKYGVKTGAELVALQERLTAQLDDFNSLEEQIQQLRKQSRQAREALLSLGLSIEEKRLAAKPSLEEKIVNLLTQVGFKAARFEVAVERNFTPDGMLELEGQALKPLATGLNKVYFLIQTNPGLPAGPLDQIASGGEISRVMLAIKAALADKSNFPVLIFDEIDTGISGEIALKVGNVMKQLAQKFQILSITHLPQIAAKGDYHFEVYKQIRGGKTYSSLRVLPWEDRIKVVAQMLSGEEPTDGAIRNAKELIEEGKASP